MHSVIFDLGGVLVDWNPRYLYRKLFTDPQRMEEFLAQVCTRQWNECQDAGRPIAEAVAELVRQHADKAELIHAYYGRWGEMLNGPIETSVTILRELKARGVRLFFLTNWSAETFPVAQERFEFLQWFDGGIVSGEAAVKKPDPRVYRLLLERYGIAPRGTLFVDDREENLKPAEELSMAAHLFRTAEGLREELRRLGLLS
jgi:2-haloacid dehalogenase